MRSEKPIKRIFQQKNSYLLFWAAAGKKYPAAQEKNIPPVEKKIFYPLEEKTSPRRCKKKWGCYKNGTIKLPSQPPLNFCDAKLLFNQNYNLPPYAQIQAQTKRMKIKSSSSPFPYISPPPLFNHGWDNKTKFLFAMYQVSSPKQHAMLYRTPVFHCQR